MVCSICPRLFCWPPQIALTWGACAYLNKNNAALLTKEGEMNIYICAGFAALFAANAAGVTWGRSTKKAHGAIGAAESATIGEWYD